MYNTRSRAKATSSTMNQSAGTYNTRSRAKASSSCAHPPIKRAAPMKRRTVPTPAMPPTVPAPATPPTVPAPATPPAVPAPATPPTVAAPAQTHINDLPIEVLVTILSLLDDPREVVQTCVLSKRWRNLWASVPRLELQYHDAHGELTRRKRLLDTFLHFANSFLLLRNNPTDLHFFKLELMLLEDLEDLVPARDLPTLMRKIHSWIVYALKHNPRSVCIECSIRDCEIEFGLNPPDYLFTSETLEDVYLNPLSELNLPDSTFLPNLKRIHLVFEHECTEINGLHELAFGCPGLENLTLERGRFEMKKDVAFPNLKKLSVHYCEFYTQAQEGGCYISAPCLEYLEFEGYRQYGNKFKDLYGVKEANIEAGDMHDIEENNCEFLMSLSHVETLQLSGRTNLIGLLEKELPKCPVFYDLKKLTLGGDYCMGCHSAILCSFLKHCPNLEILKIRHDPYMCWRLCQDDSEEFERFSCDQLGLVNAEAPYNWDDEDMARLEKQFCRMGLKDLQINFTSADGEVEKTVNINPEGVSCLWTDWEWKNIYNVGPI